MSGPYRSQKTPFIAYKKELQKHFAANYNHSTTDFTSKNADFSSRTEYVGTSSSPIIQIKSIRFNTKVDGLKHHTARYGLMQRHQPMPVFRRGQSFSMTIEFNRNYTTNEDFFYFLAEYGPSPNLSKGTKVKLTPSSQPDGEGFWKIWIDELDNTQIKVQVLTPSNCQVGLWKLHLVTYHANSNLGTLSFEIPEDVFIIFNPWNKSDTVFLEDIEERKEYVLNQHGGIYSGTCKQADLVPWVFGQFDMTVLPAVLLLLEQSQLPYAARGNPILLSRAISAVVNSYDDDGLLEGKWDEIYNDGTSPMSWTGSVAIYNEYLQTGKTVKYGQCWVFAGVVTTACRALGIPCRPITCFVCAHDTDHSLTIDNFFDMNGKLIDGGPKNDCYDSTWNFHCWNDVWMLRPDLPPGYDGWQAIDGTPQEISSNKYRTGPSPLKAIKEGTVGLQFDTGFIFSEVNADVCHFREDSSSAWGFTRVKLMSRNVGRSIVTLGLQRGANGERAMEDITSLYKYKEGTEAERSAVFNAIRNNPTSHMYYKSVNPQNVRDVYFKLEEIEIKKLGESFTVNLSIENHSNDPRTVKANMTVRAVLYTGKILSNISETNIEINLSPKEAKTGKLVVQPGDYMSYIGKNYNFKAAVFAAVVETEQNFIVEDDFEILKTKLDVKVPTVLKEGASSEVDFFLTNPLAETLTRCELVMEGLGLHQPKTVKLGNVGPNGQFKHTENLVPTTEGSQMIVATFNSDKLSGVKGFTTVMVQPC